MTELEILAHAKLYIEKLANGIDPLSDEAVPENDTINQVRISRCLFYVANVLGQVIENGGLHEKPKPREKKRPFFIDEEALSAYRFSERPVSVSEMVRQLNELSHADNMKKLTYPQVSAWLMAQDLFKEVEYAGRKTKRPTEKGISLGISTEKRSGPNGNYTIVLFDLNAQKYLISHLPEIVLSLEKQETEEPQQEPPRTGRWTPDDDDFLLALFRRGVSVDEMRRTLRRDPSEIADRLRSLGAQPQDDGTAKL